MFIGRDQIAELLKRNAQLTNDQALGELKAPLALADAALNTEDWFVIGQRLCMGGAFIAAGGAGTRSMVGLSNLTPSGQLPGIVVLERFSVMNNAVAGAIIVRINAGISSGGVGFTRDTRWGALSRSVYGQIQNQAVVPVTGTLVANLCRLPANESKTFDFPMVLSPGNNIALENGIDNTAIEAFFWWRELDVAQR